MRALTMDEVLFVSGGETVVVPGVRRPSYNNGGSPLKIIEGTGSLPTSTLNPTLFDNSVKKIDPKVDEPTSSDPSGSITVGNNAAQISGTLPLPNGSVLTGTINAPYNGSPPSGTITYTTPGGTSVTIGGGPNGPSVGMTIPF